MGHLQVAEETSTSNDGTLAVVTYYSGGVRVNKQELNMKTRKISRSLKYLLEFT
ncbi:hypothetical protein Mapa_002078 [Marchantia paleacea]|nr:hypothetical protein Mapa_002078 [Marchantia paleacea]